MTKIFFSDNFKLSSKKLSKMISADVKDDVKQNPTKTGSYTSNFLSEVPSSKLGIQCRIDKYFSFNLVWYSIQVDIVC